MRDISKVIIHCSATKDNQDFSAKDIDNWHKEKGWSGIGYHYVIKRDGTLEVGRAEERKGAHCKGHNIDSIGICYIGGINSTDGQPQDNRTYEQTIALRTLVKSLKIRYPQATVQGHNEFSNKDCPCFDVKEEFKNI